jgi:hypothetical protein
MTRKNTLWRISTALTVAALAAAYPAASLAGDGGGGPTPTAPVHQ